MRVLTCGLFAAALMTSAAVSAAENMKTMDHSGEMDHGAMKVAADAPSTKAYEAADMAMHKAMKRSYTGDADKDFLAGMIPHHQGAIAMAKVALQYGKNPKVRAMAEKIVADQEREIAEMKEMLAAAK
ncbi:DUF305 domain-containing protein [Hansschlegelia quercus]|uniref:DUF305 domain-containing protein n=1 Tax=Hansschlegelia quercus TaxID=2528245 RepID=A0A4Q9GDM6_9HYPH|nr:DUF305 domain-containing protein [Hansschlegelia quercus]TBN48350.1 DUF305 domain-containing protein [Hansschlegelia quercus]